MQDFNVWAHDLNIRNPSKINTSSWKTTRWRQHASSEQADAHNTASNLKWVGRCKLDMSVHCYAWTSLSIDMLEWASTAKRFPLKTVNEKKFLSNIRFFLLIYLFIYLSFLSLYLIAQMFFFKGTVMQIQKAMINDCLRVSKVSWKFCIRAICNFAVIYSWICSFLKK